MLAAEEGLLDVWGTTGRPCQEEAQHLQSIFNLLSRYPAPTVTKSASFCHPTRPCVLVDLGQVEDKLALSAAQLVVLGEMGMKLKSWRQVQQLEVSADNHDVIRRFEKMWRAERRCNGGVESVSNSESVHLCQERIKEGLGEYTLYPEGSLGPCLSERPGHASVQHYLKTRLLSMEMTQVAKIRPSARWTSADDWNYNGMKERIEVLLARLDKSAKQPVHLSEPFSAGQYWICFEMVAPESGQLVIARVQLPRHPDVPEELGEQSELYSIMCEVQTMRYITHHLTDVLVPEVYAYAEPSSTHAR